MKSAGLYQYCMNNSVSARDVILNHWAPSWLIQRVTLAVYNEIVVSIFYFVVSLAYYRC